jgi:oligosaccharide repeat unit polymerase
MSWILIYQPAPLKKAFVFGSATILLPLFFIVTQRMIVDSSGGTASTLGTSLLSYAGLSPLAYESIVNGQYPRKPGLYSLDAIYFALNKFNVVSEYPGLDRSYIMYPLVTNIYTFLDTFTLDFGITGALLGAGIVGFVSSRIYVRARLTPNIFNITLYAFLVYACALAPANNEFIRFGFILNGVIAWSINQWVTCRHKQLAPARHASATAIFREPIPGPKE